MLANQVVLLSHLRLLPEKKKIHSCNWSDAAVTHISSLWKTKHCICHSLIERSAAESTRYFSRGFLNSQVSKQNECEFLTRQHLFLHFNPFLLLSPISPLASRLHRAAHVFPSPNTQRVLLSHYLPSLTQPTWSSLILAVCYEATKASSMLRLHFTWKMQRNCSWNSGDQKVYSTYLPFFFFYPYPFLKIASWIWCRVTTFSDCANVYQWQQQKAALTSNCSVDELPVKLPRHTETSSVHRILGVVKQSSNSLMKEPSKLNQSKKERTASIQGSLAAEGWERCSPKTPYAYL